MVNEVYNLGKTTSFNINLEIDDASSFGKQINYFRKLKNIRAKDMAKALNIGYSTILRIENDNFNRKLNHQSIIILNKIIDYMDIRDKLNFSNNDYLDFILNKQSSIIAELKEKIGRIKLAKKLKVSADSVTRWINNEVVISKENYAKLKDILKN